MASLRRVLMPVFLALPLLLAACGSSSSGAASSSVGPAVTLNVFAAASLTGAFNAEKATFQKAHPNVNIVYNFGGSNTLAQQITNGAPADVFASANPTQMKVVVTGGEVDQSAVQTFARNKLVIITPSANPANIKQPQDLAKGGLKLALGAKGVPVGDYAVQFLANASKDPGYSADYQTKVLNTNTVSYETDVKVVVTKVQLGEADAGIVYTTDAAAATGQVNQVMIPDNLNVIATYPIAPIKASAHLDVANQFITDVLSTAGEANLAKYGFLPPNG